ncbi:MAG: hypothetical protein GEV11_17230 [Streptosporangiales bacterium]|nr:hypothetical protein [Streptosporangiales bacterium]
MRAAKIVAVAVAAVAALFVAAPAALAHDERPVTLPDGSGSVPKYRTGGGPELLVCKTDPEAFAERIAGYPAEVRARNAELFERCRLDGFRHLQEAVDAAEPGARILMLPGVYTEEPSRRPPEGECARLPARWAHTGGTHYQVLSFEQTQDCPNNQNLVAVLGKRDLQIEGTGPTPGDVVLDAGYAKLNALRADRANGIYLRNFTAQRTTFNAIYILETDGFVIDRAVGRWTDEYGFLTFATDHGLYTDCEAYGNGDSGVYPGSASNLNATRGHDVTRYAVEIRRCRSHHNLLGYSGTAGDSVWAHDNEFYANSAGASMDSAFPGHPGLPQNHALFENNRIHDNNTDYNDHVRDGTCALPPAERGYEEGVVCPAAGVPVGTGILTAGGNYNVFRNNQVYGHSYTGFALLWVPAFIRGESALSKQADTSHHNRYTGNRLGVAPDGKARPNATDFWWDGQGKGNCWQPSATGSDPVPLPHCGDAGTARVASEPVKLAKLYLCADYDLDARRVPAGCDWYGASGMGRYEVRIAVGAATLVALVGLLLWARRLYGTRRTTIAGAATLLAGAATSGAIGAAAAEFTAPWIPSVVLGVFGLWWIAVGWALYQYRTIFAPLSILLGVVALLDVVDRSVWMFPFIPLSPDWLVGLLGLLWIVGALIVVVRRARSERVVPEIPEP